MLLQTDYEAMVVRSQGARFGVLGDGHGGVVHGRDLDRVARGRVDRGADVVEFLITEGLEKTQTKFNS
jgi:hypothetical protein